MKPRIRKWAVNWWTVYYIDRHGRHCQAYADTWYEALDLVAHGYREGYFG